MCSGGGGDKNIGRAAKKQAELAEESLAWFKSEYAATEGDRLAAQKRANEIGDFQLGQMREQDQRADELYAFDKQYTRPIQERLATEALNYDTPERRQAAAAAAAADVQMASSNQQGVLSRNLARAGVNPAAAQSVQAQQAASLQTAANTAGAMNNARTQVENTGYQRMVGAANGGAQVAGRADQAAGMAGNAGTAAIGASSAALGARTAGLGGMQTAYNSAGQMLGQSGNLYAQNAQLKAQGDGAIWGALGQAAGMAGMYALGASDKNIKSGTGKKADGAAALEAIEATPVDAGWTYDPAKGGPDDGGQPHTGPMAQDVAATMGEKVAPGGKAIDLISMNGVTMAAVQEVSKRLKKIEQKVAA